MTTLTPMLQFIQDKILLAVHPGCSIEEARQKEFGFGCIIRFYEEGFEDRLGYLSSRKEDISDTFPGGEHKQTCETIYMVNTKSNSRDEDIEKWYNSDGYTTIIGLPPTLSRVLTALEKEYGNYFYHTELGIRIAGDSNYIKRKLLNEEGTDGTLFDQSEETQRSIAILFGRKDEA